MILYIFSIASHQASEVAVHLLTGASIGADMTNLCASQMRESLRLRNILIRSEIKVKECECVSTMRRKENLRPFLSLRLFFHVLCVPRRTPRQLRMQSRLLNKRPSQKIPELDND